VGKKQPKRDIPVPFVAADFWGIDFASLSQHASFDL
jgi:hypothetical protein